MKTKILLIASLSIFISTSYGQTPLAHWNLNEITGTIAVDDIGGFNGTYTGGVIPGGGTPFLDGSPTPIFDGNSGLVLLPPSSSLSPTWNELTVEAWVHLDLLVGGLGFQAILSPPDHGFVHFQSGIGDNAIYTGINPPVGIDVSIYPGSSLLSEWHYVVLVAKPGDSRVYLDGARFGSNNTSLFDSIAQPNPTVNLQIGSGYGYSRFWNGSIANVTIFKVALTDEQVLSRYNSVVQNGCVVPSNLSVTNITSTSAKLNWDAVAGAEGYKIHYKVSGTNPWITKNSNGNSKNLHNLSPNTSYTWQVKTFCTINPGLSSDWSAKQDFTTAPLRMIDESLQQTSFQIYPNPAEDHATIQFSVGVLTDTLAQSSHVSIKVYDVSGKEIETLVDGDVEQGEHSVVLNTNQFSKGVYMVRMIGDFGIENQKLIVQ